MQPLTLRTPKPLLTVAGKPLLYHTLDMLLLNQSIKRIFVNCHHLAPQILDAIDNYPFHRNKVELIPLIEEKLLDTGGTVVQLATHINSEAIITMNGDSLFTHENHSARLADKFDEKQMDFLMMLQPISSAVGYQGRGEFDINPQTGQLQHNPSEAHQYVFTGLQILKPQYILQHQPDTIFSLRELFYPATHQNRVYGTPNNTAWYHASTPQDLENINHIYSSSAPSTAG